MSVTEEESFLLIMLETPSESNKAVWCDWLEEGGDPRADILRTNRCYGYNEVLPIELDLAIITTKGKAEDVIAVKIRHHYIEWTLLTYLSSTKLSLDSPYSDYYGQAGKDIRYVWMSNGSQVVANSRVPLIVRVAAKYNIHKLPWPYVKKVTP